MEVSVQDHPLPADMITGRLSRSDLFATSELAVVFNTVHYQACHCYIGHMLLSHRKLALLIRIPANSGTPTKGIGSLEPNSSIIGTV